MEIQKLFRDDPRYPSLLAATGTAPECLYYSGNLEVLQAPCLAVVGTRRCTARGESTTLRFAESLAAWGVTIVSGLAFGIDAAAHEGALRGNGKTVAVLAQGLNVLRPTVHRQLAEGILEKGGLLLSEYAPNEERYKSDYLLRNRLIAGLCSATLVVEAGYPSGALNTAKHALTEGRDVLCVPGRIEDEASIGCLDLIKRGAHLVTLPSDLIPILKLRPEKQHTVPVHLKGLERELYEILKKHPCSSSELTQEFSGRLVELYEALTQLELRGLLVQTQNRSYTVV
ncbi:DNA-protecting protein DprA [Candidatus Peregrinibacteria bacterium]|nr:MAG: DNA-protecting protein DprA [Candidatus Peregrinibacteria bacterium]